jgi:peptidoglycan/xylan/chitin deacetylase (PgdA/CDA1 family)
VTRSTLALLVVVIVAGATLTACTQDNGPRTSVAARTPLGAASGKPSLPTVNDGRGLVVPILLYHRIGYRSSRFTLPPVSPDRFTAQMRAIAQSGVATLTMDELYEAVRTGRAFPHGVVALTFDDATQDHYTTVMPVLRRYKLHATFYVPTGRVGHSGYVTWAELARMQATGLVTIASHTIHHLSLTTIPEAEARREISESKATLEQRLRAPVTAFAYPFGTFSPKIEALVRRAGYLSAVTTQGGETHALSDALEWTRLHVSDASSPQGLVAMALSAGRRVKGSAAAARA